MNTLRIHNVTLSGLKTLPAVHYIIYVLILVYYSKYYRVVYILQHCSQRPGCIPNKCLSVLVFTNDIVHDVYMYSVCH